MQAAVAPSPPLVPLRRRWVFPAAPPAAAVERLARELRLPGPLCRLLVLRGVQEPAAVREFLKPHAGQIHEPRLAGVDLAVERLVAAIGAGETVLVHGDYDVDGICATALFVRAIRMLGGRAEPFIPHRVTDGYDLGDAGIAAAVAVGARLIVTADCGVVAHDAVDRARAAGIDVIVTDHHTPGATLPGALAVVNPNRADCGYPNKSLAGAGVAYKVCCALAAALGHPDDRMACFLDLVALATVADMVPLTGENRALVRWGLKVLAGTPNPGLRALLRRTGLTAKPELTAGHVGYILGPRLNAVGRIGEALTGARLLLTDDEREADEIAARLEADNRARQALDDRILREALSVLEREYEPTRDRGVVVAGEGWHPGVIGIVASRVVERIHRPTVVIGLDGAAEARGSARSIPGFDMYAAMSTCAGHLIRFGGHRGAAGCSIAPERVEAFRAAFDACARDSLGPDQLVPEVRVDLELQLRDAALELVRMLRHVAPCGQGNPTPVFAVRGVRPAGRARVVGQRHLKLTLATADARLDAIGFGMADRAAELADAAPIDVAFRLEENVWNGRTTVQARIVDFRPAEP